MKIKINRNIKIRRPTYLLLFIVLFILLLFLDIDFFNRESYVAGFSVPLLNSRVELRSIWTVVFLTTVVLSRERNTNLLLVIFLTFWLSFNNFLQRGVFSFQVLNTIFSHIFLWLGPFILLVWILRIAGNRLRLSGKKCRVVRFLRWFVFILLIFETLLGVIQVFYRRIWLTSIFHTILVKLGESPTLPSKAVLGNQILPRAYGSFAHPNIFAFVMLWGLIAFVMLTRFQISQRQGFKARGLSLEIFAWSAVFLSMLLSFSKTGLLIYLIILSLFLLRNKIFNGQILRLVWFLGWGLLLIIPFILLIVPFNWYFVETRNLIFKQVLELIHQSWGYKEFLFGVGYLRFFPWFFSVGTSVPLYSGRVLVEPIHNIFWMYFIENGILGVVVVVFVTLFMFAKIKKYWEKSSSYGVFGVVVRWAITSYIILYFLYGAFDHFLYY